MCGTKTCTNMAVCCFYSRILALLSHCHLTRETVQPYTDCYSAFVGNSFMFILLKFSQINIMRRKLRNVKSGKFHSQDQKNEE
jgi:hypothetical protein